MFHILAQALGRFMRSAKAFNGDKFVRYAGRASCKPVIEPKCSPENIKRLKPCVNPLPPEPNKNLKGGSMWENPECCKISCSEFEARYDELYYKTSDKLKRNYQQTWVSCPGLHIIEIPVCCTEEYNVAPMEKRPRKKRIVTTCGATTGACLGKKSQKCPRLTNLFCSGKTPPSCLKDRNLAPCERERNPYPSFSECLRCPQDPARPVECFCLRNVPMCEVWAEYRRKLSIVQNVKANDNSNDN